MRLTKVEVLEPGFEGPLTRAFLLNWQLGLGLNKRFNIELCDWLKVPLGILEV